MPKASAMPIQRVELEKRTEQVKCSNPSCQNMVTVQKGSRGRVLCSEDCLIAVDKLRDEQ